MKPFFKTKLLSLAFAGALGFSGEGRAEEIQWAHDYEASSNQLPTELSASWKQVYKKGEVTAAGGVLTIDAPKQSHAAFRMGTAFDRDAETDWNPVGVETIVEIRLKVEKVSVEEGKAQALMINTGARSYMLSFGMDFVSPLHRQRETGFVITPGQFHTYRIQIDRRHIAIVSVDGEKAFSIAGEVTPEKYIEIGHGYQALDGGRVQYEFLRWAHLGEGK